jgi:hypothetical protein
MVDIQILPVRRVGTDRIYAAVLALDAGQTLGLQATISDAMWRRMASQAASFKSWAKQHVRMVDSAGAAPGGCLGLPVPVPRGRKCLCSDPRCGCFGSDDMAGAAFGAIAAALAERQCGAPQFAELAWNWDDWGGADPRLLGDLAGAWIDEWGGWDQGGAIVVPTRLGAGPTVVKANTTELLHRFAVVAGYL